MSQKDKLYNLLSDGQAHSTPEIAEIVYGNEHLGLSRVGARINDLVKRGCIFLDKYGAEIKGENIKRGWKDSERPTIYWYQMKTRGMIPRIPDGWEFGNNQMAMKL